jgi:potassium-dependent mechanosensitive channel
VQPILVTQGPMQVRFSSKSLGLFLYTVVGAVALWPYFVQGQSAPAPASPAAQTTAAAMDAVVPPPIPLVEVATEAEAAVAHVRELVAEISADPTMPAVMEQLPLLTREIDARLRQTRRILAQGASIEMLGDLEREWRPLQRNLARWQRQLTTYLGRHEREIAELEELRKVWRETLEAGQASNVPPEVLSRIQAVIAEIEKAREVIERHRSGALTLQSRVAAQDSRIADALGLIAQTRENALDRLFIRDSPPIWSLDIRSHSAQELRAERSNLSSAQWVALSAYAARQMPSFFIHAAIFLVISLGLLWLRRRVQSRLKEEGATARSAILCETPTAAAFLVSLLLTRWIYPQGPRLLFGIVGALALIPSAIILRHLIPRDLFLSLYGLAIFYVIDQLRMVVAAGQFLPRLLLAGEMLGIIGLLVWLLRSVDRLDSQISRFRRLKMIIKVAATLALIFAAAAFLANITGYVTLANLLGNAILNSAYFAFILYALIELIDSAVMIALWLSPLRMLRIIATHGALIRHRIHRTLQWTAVLLWFLFALDRLLLRERLFRAVSDFLTEELAVGSLRITLSHVLIFFVTIWAAVLTSRFIRFVLDEEVFPRVHLARGLPYAISHMVNYVIVMVGFFAGVAALGVDMTKVTILAGAFSVGVGFGLQNVFNNFVSGLILLFERPVNVGDIVQIDDASGVVERIGIRASIIGTPSGAEVIVPNGKLISDRVINWTFSNRRRSIELQIAVALVVDPRRIITLLERAANEHPHISRDPPPKALVVKLGPDSLGLELRAWTERIHDWMQVRSELAIAVRDTLAAENIELRAI